MERVTKIAWRIQTGSQWWSGTDTEIDMEILRDGKVIQPLRLEPGMTSRLNRSENATYFWVFRDPNPNGIGVSYSGFTPPYYEAFPNGVHGHLKVKFIARGDDAWEKVSILSTVFSGEIKGVPGTIDSLFWDEHRQEFFFGADVVISTDSGEGFRTWTLAY